LYDVITIGSATVDVFASIDKKFSQVKKGDKILIKDLMFETGGGGVNSAVGLSRLRLKTAFLGKLGHDLNAYKILYELRKEKVSVIKTKPSKKQTSYSFIELSSKEGDRIIYTHKGASDDLEYKEVPKLRTKWVYMATLLGKSFKTGEQIAENIKDKGIGLLFNPSSYLAAKGKKYLRKILNSTTILILNKKEAKLLLGTKSDDVLFMLGSLQKLGPKIVVITDGAKGVHAFDMVKGYYIKPHNIKVVNTAGAGDAFASGFLAGIIKYDDIKTGLRFGLANAESVIKYHGAKNKLLTYSEIKKYI
jgi:sugar/nucleoside kinase (ribokinase family)